MEFLLVEAFGKVHEPDKAFKILQADARKLRKAGKHLDDVSDLSGLNANGLDDSMWRTVGEHVILSHLAITKNVNDVLQKRPLTPCDIGIVTSANVKSERFNYEVKNITGSSMRLGKVGDSDDYTFSRLYGGCLVVLKVS